MTACPHTVPIPASGGGNRRVLAAGPLASAQVVRRVWDSNPRGHSRALAVFKTYPVRRAQSSLPDLRLLSAAQRGYGRSGWSPPIAHALPPSAPTVSPSSPRRSGSGTRSFTPHPGRPSALPGPPLAQLVLGRGQAGKVGLVPVPLDLPPHVGQQVFGPVAAEPGADPAIGGPHQARHADVERRRSLGRGIVLCTHTEDLTAAPCVPTRFVVLCGYRVLAARNAAATAARA